MNSISRPGKVPMSEVDPFNLPEITDKDIRWAASLLGLSENAFHGEDGNDPRLNVLKCINNIDVAACPGSGKTTLLVAKLAILANKWKYRTRGICVLSHTNAARREIEQRLGSTDVGRQLLAYPHYIGTIHGFVDTFLALPWLRSRGYPIRIIDTDICLARRWKSLPSKTRLSLTRARKNSSVLTIKSPNFDVGRVKWGKGELNPDSPTYRQMKEVCKQSIVDGFFCHEEMLMWADTCLEHLPELVYRIRERFPILFIDETQDNSEEQSKLLYRVFMDGDRSVLRQRFGDSNQAIYNFVGAKETTTDIFPNHNLKMSIPNSHRFGTTVANLAKPFAVNPHDGGLKGNGPRSIFPGTSSKEGPHTIFLFDDNTIDKVLPAYAELLIKIFSDDELKHGVFTAVGQVHNDTGDKNCPRHVGHYWPDYDPELTKANPQPQTFVQYLRAGQEQAETIGETYPVVEKIAQGILRLAGMAEGGRDIRVRKQSHRYVLDLLEEKKEARKLYQLLLSQISIKRKLLTKKKWDVCWSKVVRKISEEIAESPLNDSAANSFLSWPDVDILDKGISQKDHHDNLYRYPVEDPKVHIKVGSIHSVKGQTHTATLVLETFWHTHNLKSLKQWLLGKRCNGPSDNKKNESRLKLYYVAMTRPTHLLCLAMKRESFNKSEINQLEKCGWKIMDVI